MVFECPNELHHVTHRSNTKLVRGDDDHCRGSGHRFLFQLSAPPPRMNGPTSSARHRSKNCKR